MKRNLTYRMGAMLLASVLCVAAHAQIPDGYYANLKGKKGAELKNAVHDIIKSAKVLSYGSGIGHTWDGFYSTDRNADNSVTDRYCNDVRYFGAKGEAVSGMNIEHSFPKAWWGGSKNQAYKDLYNLMPCEQKINTSKADYPMGEVTNVKVDNGCTKVGTGHSGYDLWEPADKWKGDFARGYMYMATAYQNLSWTGKRAPQILQNGDYPTLQKWAYTLYIEWAKADKPDEVEIKRNNAVSEIQKNRNPFVDFPNLMEYIWGDSIDYAFDPDKTLRTSEGGGSTGPTDPTDPTETTLYTAIFTNEDGGCTEQDIVSPGFTVWTRDNKYGWKGTAFKSNKKYEAESVLSTPEIDLTNYAAATLTFRHAVNYCTSPGETYSVEVLCDGNTTMLSGITWPAGNNWTFNDSGDISLSEFAGKKIKIMFRYKSTTSESGTWEIEKMSVTGKAAPASVSTVARGENRIDMSKPYKAYSADGREVNPSNYDGIIILKQGDVTLKVKK